MRGCSAAAGTHEIFVRGIDGQVLVAMGSRCSRFVAGFSCDVRTLLRDFSGRQFSAPASLCRFDDDSGGVYPRGEKSRCQCVASFCRGAVDHCSAVAWVERSAQQSRERATPIRHPCVLWIVPRAADEHEHLLGNVLNARLTVLLFCSFPGSVPRYGLDGSDVTLAVCDSFFAAECRCPLRKVLQNQRPGY